MLNPVRIRLSKAIVGEVVVEPERIQRILTDSANSLNSRSSYVSIGYQSPSLIAYCQLIEQPVGIDSSDIIISLSKFTPVIPLNTACPDVSNLAP